MTRVKRIGFFEKYLTLWVALCIAVGIVIGNFAGDSVAVLSKMELFKVNIPVAILVWLMIYPMMLQVDFSSIKNVGKRPKGLILTLVVNWLIKPFTMAFFAWIFFTKIYAAFISPELAGEYIAGAILLGAAPCTAMVFVWSYLSDGDPNYTLVQVSVNDLIMVFAFAPIAAFLLGVSDIQVPWETLLLSVVLYVVLPLLAGVLTRRLLAADHQTPRLQALIAASKPFSVFGLICTVVILFALQAQTIVARPLDIVLIAIPLLLQTYGIFFIAYFLARRMRLAHNIAAPACMIGTSNFFELAVAVAISLFGLHSGAALATVVGVLVEVPVMLSLVAFANKTRHWFE